MGLPGHRRTSSHKRRRAAHFALKSAAFGICTKCKNSILPHTACQACGYYKGREVLKMPVLKTSGKSKQEKHEHKK